MKKTHRAMILDFVESKGTATRTEILTFICKEFWGIDYNRSHRGTYGCAFTVKNANLVWTPNGGYRYENGALMHQSGKDPRYLAVDPATHKYSIAYIAR